VTAGSTIIVPVSVTAGPVALNITSADVALTFDPTVLQFVSATNNGTLLNGFSSQVNPDNTGGSIRLTEFTGGSGAALAASTGASLINLTFQVNPNASGPTVLNVMQSVSPTITNLNAGGITLSPAPTNAPTDTGVDGIFTVIAAPTNQPPQDTVPTAVQQVLAGGTLTFDAGHSNAIKVADYALPQQFAITSATESGATVTVTTASTAGFTVGQSIRVQGVTTTGYNGTWTVTAVSGSTFSYTAATGLTTPAVVPSTAVAYSVVGPVETGNEQTTLTAAHGTLKPGASVPGDVTVAGSGTGTLMLTGPVTDITTALIGLTYTGTAGYSGPDSLTVTTNDQGNSGAGGAQTDSRTVQIQDVRLFINEIFVNPNDPNLVIQSGTGSISQYVEIRSSVPNFTLPAGTYLAGVNGQNQNSIGAYNPGTSLGLVQDLFDLSGKQTGSNGVLAIVDKGSTYSSAGVVDPAGTLLTNAGSGSGFGSGTGSTVGHTGLGGAVDMQIGSASYFLFQSPTAPAVGTTDVDAANNGTLNGGATSSWNIQDSVGFTDATNTDATNTDRAYGALNFVDKNGTGQAINTVVSMTGLDDLFAYMGRNANSTGTAATDWLGATVSNVGTSGTENNFVLGNSSTNNAADVSQTGFAGRRLNNIAGLNYFAINASVQINDGNAQRSQVLATFVNFNGPVSFNQSDLTNIFKIKDSANTALTLVFTAYSGVGGSGTIINPVGGVYSGVQSVRISFASGSTDTYNLTGAPLTAGVLSGLTVALNDGNYFLAVNGSLMTDAFGQHVDAAGNGLFGSVGTTEFYRLYGDFNGDRVVDYTDQVPLGAAIRGNANRGGTLGQKNLYRLNWYFDYDGDGLINTTDYNNQFKNRIGTVIAP
jgi:hypothetical protein